MFHEHPPENDATPRGGSDALGGPSPPWANVSPLKANGSPLEAAGSPLEAVLRSRAYEEMELARHVLSVLANGAESVFLYRFGLLAGLAQRSATYVLWHLAWPLLGVSGLNGWMA